MGAPKALVDKVGQVARLIRSADPFQGGGDLFRHPEPGDVPEDILGQLGNRFQHALRAFYRARSPEPLRLAAETYRENPRFATEAGASGGRGSARRDARVQRRAALFGCACVALILAQHAAMAQAVIKELKGTTGRRIVRCMLMMKRRISNPPLLQFHQLWLVVV